MSVKPGGVATAAVVLAMLAAPLVFAGVITRAGDSSGVIESVSVEAAAKTEVRFWKVGADTTGDHPPFTFDGRWIFTWDDEQPGSVHFTGVIDFGDYFTLTDAGGMGGVSKQTFFGFAHHVEGTAAWNEATRTLSFDLPPEGRDDARASTVTQNREPECEKIKGMFAGKACKAFLKTSPGLEGLELSFTFTEGLDSFEGTAVLIQYGGSGMTKSETRIVTRISGELTLE